jgi:hypothetical protein
MENHQSFDLVQTVDFSEEQLISCFQEIHSLFFNSTQIEISQSNVLIFQYFSAKFQDSTLSSICQRVMNEDGSCSFYLTSEIFSKISSNILSSLNNFHIRLSSGIIECNAIYSSLISHQIYKHLLIHQTFDHIDLSNF